jgi:hypothetical protein
MERNGLLHSYTNGNKGKKQSAVPDAPNGVRLWADVVPRKSAGKDSGDEGTLSDGSVLHFALIEWAVISQLNQRTKALPALLPSML